jgi:long-subunit fatty acid transport protein
MDKRTVRSPGVFVCTFLGLAASLFAQNPPIIQPPGFTLTLPNYLMTPIGQTAGLEGGAFVARANDASSNWYNPAGLALAHQSSVSSSAGSYQLLSVVPEDLQTEDSGGSSQQVPALVGVVVKKLFPDDRWTLGFSAVRTNSWEHETDAQIDQLALPPSRLLSYSADSQFRRNEFSLGMGYGD